jgi:hypothetical protein
MAFTSVLVNGQFGFGDRRVLGSVELRREGPAGRFSVAAYRSVREVEPWTGGLGFGNSVNALLTGHDDADYLLTLGAGLAYTWNNGPLADAQFGVYWERHRSMDVVPRGIWRFPANPPVAESEFLRAMVTKDARLGPLSIRSGVDLLAGEVGTAGRGWASLSLPFEILRRSGRIVVRAGAVRGDGLPQLAVRLGGPQTVRGYTYGVRAGREFWSAQLDVAVLESAWLMPVIFADVGDTFDRDPIAAVGVGVSLLNGLVRLNLAKGVRPSRGARLDVHFRAPR